MATICPRCDGNGNRVEMKVGSIRCERRATKVPGDTYPDGTVTRWDAVETELTVCLFQCPACGLSEEGVNIQERPAAVPSP